MRQNILGLFIGVLIIRIVPVCAENSSFARIQTTPAALVPTGARDLVVHPIPGGGR
jgi:hypothetical protein